MRPSLKSLRSRAQDAAERARDLGGGASAAAGEGPTVPAVDARPGARERAAMRRRARRMRRIREAQLRDLGVLVLELERRGRSNPGLVSRKASEIKAIDDEIQGIAAALGEHRKLEQLVVAGVAGSCAGCGSLLGTDDRFCSSCGAPRGAAAQPAGDGSASPLAAAAPEGQ